MLQNILIFYLVLISVSFIALINQFTQVAMQKYGFLKLKIQSVKGLINQEEDCMVKIQASNVCAQVRVSAKSIHPHPQIYLPVSDKIYLQLHCGLQNIGYFQLPLYVVFENQTKKHIMIINCIEKDTIQNTLSSKIFGILTLAIRYIDQYFPQLDLYIDRLLMVQVNNQLMDRELYVQCKIIDKISKTTIKKKKGSICEWKEHLHFTLQTIPNIIEIFIKDKDMVSDEVLGRIQVDPQNQGLFKLGESKDIRFQVNQDNQKLMIFISASFVIPESK